MSDEDSNETAECPNCNGSDTEDYYDHDIPVGKSRCCNSDCRVSVFAVRDGNSNGTKAGQ